MQAAPSVFAMNPGPEALDGAALNPRPAIENRL
jgi:hypothetical protein